jgi:N4-gp56 family major capsid protein
MAGNFQWIPDISSGVSRNHALSNELRFASIAETLVVQFARPEPGFGAHMGETVTIQRIRNIAEPTSAVLTQAGKVPIDQMAMSTRSITVSEFGRGIGYTRLVQLLNKFDIENAIQKALKKQMKLTIDTVAGTAMKTCQIRFGPTSGIGGTFTTDAGSTAVTGTNNMTVAHVKIIRDYLRKTLHCDPYQGQVYMCLASTKACRGIKDDPEFHAWRQYLRPGDVFFNAEIGEIEKIRFVEVDHDNVLTERGTGSAVGEALFFGDDMLALAEVEAPELLAGIPADLGRQRMVGWLGTLGFSGVWNDSSSDGEARSVYFTSS